ncbi:HET-domain-containing protein [Pyrenochaeta sp. DS3sAY3a]|nr:HET-domain-containing protein [Pyrenochaeta sp. DS3sAY3a]
MALPLYSPSPLSPGQIRLLTILPGKPGSLIMGTMRVHTLGCPHAYKALSYTWGAPKFQVPIRLNDQLLHIGANLHAALTELRDENELIVLWADAVCINQRSNEEKNVQVPLMHHVYQFAVEVIVWLGRNSEDSDEAMGLVQQLADCKTMDIVTELMSARATGSSPEKAWRPLAQLFARPWWTRVWVLQEVAFGKKVMVVCGSAKQLWLNFAVVAFILRRYSADGGFHDKARPDRLELPDSSLMAFACSFSAFAIVERFPFRLEYAITTLVGPRVATDPRDKIFAVLNLVPRDEWPCAPNYDMNTKDLYTLVTKHLIRRSRNLNVLANCWNGDWYVTDKKFRPKFQQKRLEGLPTWVVDWTLLNRTSNFLDIGSVDSVMDAPEVDALSSGGLGPHQTCTVSEHMASITNKDLSLKAEKANHRFEADNILIVYSVTRTRVRDVDAYPCLSKIFNTLNPTCFHAFTSFIATHLDVDCNSTIDSMINLLLAFEYALLTWQTSNTHETCFPYEDYFSWRRVGTPVPNHKFVGLILDSVQDRVLVWTEDGEFGLAPWGTRTGDWIAQIKDCQVPLVLRPAEKKEAEGKDKGRQLDEECSACYTLLGQAYVLGWGMEEDESRKLEDIRLV